MTDNILQQLRQFEEEKKIKILYAVESGSRAWGFASTNSDWDVRVIYIHEPDWYLSIDTNKEYFESITGELDFAGWELRKALRLFRKSNPPLLEWLNSPIVYSENFATASAMRKLSATYFNPKSCLFHYYNMAKRNFNDYLTGEFVRIKKYFYVLRPVLACMWIEQTDTMAPTEFHKLYDRAVPAGTVRHEIEVLLGRKISGEEMDREEKNTVLSNFLQEKILYYNDYIQNHIQTLHQPDTNKLDALFRTTLQEVW